MVKIGVATSAPEIESGEASVRNKLVDRPACDHASGKHERCARAQIAHEAHIVLDYADRLSIRSLLADDRLHGIVDAPFHACHRLVKQEAAPFIHQRAHEPDKLLLAVRQPGGQRVCAREQSGAIEQAFSAPPCRVPGRTDVARPKQALCQ
jgi:hypothetical protein